MHGEVAVLRVLRDPKSTDRQQLEERLDFSAAHWNFKTIVRESLGREDVWSHLKTAGSDSCKEWNGISKPDYRQKYADHGLPSTLILVVIHDEYALRLWI